MSVQAFFDYAREREKIRLLREADDPWSSGPWTDDPIFQLYRFCNVFREDDTTTKWIRSHLTQANYGDKLLQATMIARWFNRITTIRRLLPLKDTKNPLFRKDMLLNWNSATVRERLQDVRPLVTGAYMVKTPADMSKLEGLVQCIEAGLPICDNIVFMLSARAFTPTLELVAHHLQAVPFLGSFMAYEIVTDLRYNVLRRATDIMTWANPGPGAARGLGRVFHQDRDHFNYQRPTDANNMLAGMRRLLEHSTLPMYWPGDWRSWEMREVEHTLCEFDKYERARLGEGRPKQRFRGGFHVRH